jgi:hypothetical protein
MVTSTSPATSVDFLGKIDQLRGQAESQGNEYQNLLNLANQKLAERNQTLLQIGEVAKSAAETTLPANITPVLSATVAAVTPVVPSQSLVPRQKRTYTKRSDAQKAASASVPASTGKRGRPSANALSLKDTIFEVLSRNPAQYKKILPEYPANETGLKVPEIKDIIEKEKSWVSSSKQLGTLVQQALYKLVEEGKAERAENRRYSLVKA